MAEIAQGCAGMLAALRQAIQPHAALLRNAGSIASGTIISSVLGFAYWWIAARCFSLEAVGLTAAAVSIMSLIGLCAQLGLGTLLIGENLSGGKKEMGLIAAALIVSCTAAIALAILFLAAASAASLDLGRITGSKAGALCFVLGCGATCCVVMLNSAFIGLLRSSFAMSQDIVLSLTKLVLLGAVAARYGSSVKEEAIFATWVVAQVASSSIFAALLRTFSHAGFPVPRFAALRALMPRSLAHHLLDIVIQAPAMVMPFVVAVMLSPAVNAAFNAAWMTLRITFSLPAGLSTILFAIGGPDREAFSSRVRFSLVLFAASGAAVVILFALFGAFILRVFNPEYPAIAANSLRVIGISFVGVAVSSLYLAIQRLNCRMIHAVHIFAAGGLAELIFACIGAHFYGLFGLALGWTAAVMLLGAYTASTVLREARVFNAALPGFSNTLEPAAKKTLPQDV